MLYIYLFFLLQIRCKVFIIRSYLYCCWDLVALRDPYIYANASEVTCNCVIVVFPIIKLLNYAAGCFAFTKAKSLLSRLR